MKTFKQFILEATDHDAKHDHHLEANEYHYRKGNEFDTAADVPEHSKSERAGFRKIAKAHHAASDAHHDARIAHMDKASYHKSFSAYANKLTKKAEATEKKHDIKFN